jgi:hypothetical protein
MGIVTFLRVRQEKSLKNFALVRELSYICFPDLEPLCFISYSASTDCECLLISNTQPMLQPEQIRASTEKNVGTCGMATWPLSKARSEADSL